MSSVYSCDKVKDLGLLLAIKWSLMRAPTLIPIAPLLTSLILANNLSDYFRVEQSLTAHSLVPTLLPFCSMSAWDTGFQHDS